MTDEIGLVLNKVNFDEFNSYPNSILKYQEASIKYEKVIRFLKTVFGAVDFISFSTTEPCKQLVYLRSGIRHFFRHKLKL